MREVQVQMSQHKQQIQNLETESGSIKSQLKTIIQKKGLENAKKDIKGKQLAIRKKKIEKEIIQNQNTIKQLQKLIDNQSKIDSFKVRQTAIRSQTTQMKTLANKRKRNVEIRALENITVHDSLEPTKSFKKKKSNKTLNSGSLFILDQGNRPTTRIGDNTQMIHIKQINTDNPISGFIKTSKNTEPSLQDIISGTTAATKKKKKKRKHTKKKKPKQTHHKKKKPKPTHHKKKKPKKTHKRKQ